MSRFSGSDLDILGADTFDPSYTAEISNKMRVPKKIQITGQGQEGERSDNDEMNGNWSAHAVRSRSSDKVQMQVPDRIMVTGQEKHVGAKAMPRELQLETVLMPPDPEIIRIQTPPRSITLRNAPNKVESDSYTSEDETLIEKNQARFERERVPNGGVGRISYSCDDMEMSVLIPRRAKREFSDRNYATECDKELEHLREQFGRVNRRLLALEEDSAERKEKERYLVMAGLLYVAYKTVSWLFKSGPPHS